MLLSILLKSKKCKYQKDNLFVARTFASKARTMSFTFGTLSMLILISLICLNFSSINKGMYKSTIELNAPYDVDLFDENNTFKNIDKFLCIIDEDYTINQTVEYNIYKEPNYQIQNYYAVEFYNYDPVMKLSDYNKLLKIRNMDTIKLNKDEYLLVTPNELLYKVENNNDIKNIQFSGNELRLKEIDTKSYWDAMNNTGRFTIVVADECVQGLSCASRGSKLMI